MADITNKAKKGRTGQTSSEQLESILNWIELSTNNQKTIPNAYLSVVKKQFDNSDDDDDDDDDDYA